MTRTLSLIAALTFSSTVLAASDPQDAEGSSDHPEIPRFPGFYIGDYAFSEFDAQDFTLQGKSSDETTTKTAEGKSWRISYYLKEGARYPAPIELFRNFENAIKKRGGKTVYAFEVRENATSTFVMPAGKTERYISLYANGADTYDLKIVEVAGMKQTLELSASEMKDALDKNGFVALYGIQFDTGKDAVKAESEPLLAEIASLLKEHADLALSIEGHTDNVGNAKANKSLSEKRAASVKKWLVKNGIPAKRLATAGFGDGKPVADNRTEEGRAKNRRVELVKK